MRPIARRGILAIRGEWVDAGRIVPRLENLAMKKWFVLMGIVALSVFGMGCEQEDIDSFSESVKDAGSRVGEAIEDTTKSLGDNIEAGKQGMRDAAEDIEKK